MHFEASYFQKEVRDGFTVSSMMKRCWAAQLEVLEDFDNFCKRTGIRYYLGFGTLLGAVRHKGFIPWDDDIDIWMLSSDIDKLVREGVDGLKELGLELISPYTDSECVNLPFRLINTRLYRLDKPFLMKYWMFPFMAGLDIFPLSYVPENKDDLELLNTLINSARYLGMHWDDEEVAFQDKWDAYMELTDVLGVKPVEKDKVANHLCQLTDRIGMMYGEKDGDQLATLLYYFANNRKIFSKDWFGDPIYLEFEGKEFPCPCQPDKVLKAEFGDNYMTPVKWTDGHDYPYYKNRYLCLMEVFRERGIQCPDIYKEM